MTATAGAILGELAQLGVAVRVAGDELWLRPASVIPPELLETARRHKAELLRFLADVGEPSNRAEAELDRFFARAEPTADGQGWFDPAEFAGPAGIERLARIRAAARGELPPATDDTWPTLTPDPNAPRELSFAERVESGYVNPGWTPAAWAVRLRQLAERCERDHPGRAAELRRWAANIRQT